MNRRATTTPKPRPTVEQVLASGKSMLDMDSLPVEYSSIETSQEALAVAAPPKDVTLRLTIVWDNPASSLDLQRALEGMRETGAAMVVKVEAVS